jgi:hypothetical protein
MKRGLIRIGTLAVTAGVLAGALVAPLAGASSHREAPAISKDPTADNTDVYAFVSPDRPSTVTLVANYIPFEEPAGGPNFFEFDPTVLYEIHVVNDTNSDATITYQFRFETEVRNPETFLYNTGQIGSIADPNWNRPQFYSVSRIDEDGRAEMLGERLPSPPVNIGPRSTPNYSTLASQAVQQLPGGRQVFAGQRDDPFYVDLGSAFDLLGLRPFNNLHRLPLPASNGIDDLGGFNVHTIALQVPKSDLTFGHTTPTDPNDPAAVIGVWASASRMTTQVLTDSTSARNRAQGAHVRNKSKAQRAQHQTHEESDWVQVSRLANPLINEVLIPMGTKDYWNSQTPGDDARFNKYYLSPEPARLINFLYPAIGSNPATAIDENNRGDLVLILLQGVPGLNSMGPGEEDLLRLNVAIPPTAPVGMGDPLGVLKGDLAGFPNGRRLEDDVVDIEVRAIAQGYGSFLAGAFGLPNKNPNNKLGDGANRTDAPFLQQFPYLGTPHQGYEHTHRAPGGTPPPLN